MKDMWGNEIDDYGNRIATAPGIKPIYKPDEKLMIALNRIKELETENSEFAEDRNILAKQLVFYKSENQRAVAVLNHIEEVIRKWKETDTVQ